MTAAIPACRCKQKCSKTPANAGVSLFIKSCFQRFDQMIPDIAHASAASQFIVRAQPYFLLETDAISQHTAQAGALSGDVNKIHADGGTTFDRCVQRHHRVAAPAESQWRIGHRAAQHLCERHGLAIKAGEHGTFWLGKVGWFAETRNVIFMCEQTKFGLAHFSCDQIVLLRAEMAYRDICVTAQ